MVEKGLGEAWFGDEEEEEEDTEGSDTTSEAAAPEMDNDSAEEISIEKSGLWITYCADGGDGDGGGGASRLGESDNAELRGKASSIANNYYPR